MKILFPWEIYNEEVAAFEASKRDAIQTYRTTVEKLDELSVADQLTFDQMKWRFEQVKHLYDKQLLRGQTIEGKITRMFGIISIAITLIGFLYIQIPFHMVTKPIKLSCVLNILQIVLAIIFFCNLLSTIYFLFKSTTLYYYSNPNVEFLTLGSDSKAIIQLTKDFTYAWLFNDVVDNFKGALVKYTIRYFGWTLTWFLTSATVEFILRGL